MPEAGRLTRTLRQIEQHRQDAAVIEVRDARGRSRPGVHVSLEQESHEFLFGCLAADVSGLPERDRQRYRSRLEEVFNVGDVGGRSVTGGSSAIIENGPPDLSRPSQQCGCSKKSDVSLRADLPDAVHSRIRQAQSGPAAGGESEMARVDATAPIRLGALRRRLDEVADGSSQICVVVSGRTVSGSVPPENAASDIRSEREFGDRVADLYTLCFAHPAVRGIVWQGFADGETAASRAGLLRHDLSPKYAHRVLHKLVKNIWHTRSLGKTDSAGRFEFRGFHGGYRVVVNSGDAPPTVTEISLSSRAIAPPPFIVPIPDEAAEH